MKTLFKLTILFVSLLILSNCSSTNKYMVKDTNEYSEITAKLLGNWGVTQYNVDGKNLLKSKYEKMTTDFDFLTRTVKFSIWVSEGEIGDKLLSWKKKFPGIKVDEYKIIYSANWKVSSDGKYVAFSEPNTDLTIKGSGNNFDGFYQWEKGKFNMAKSSDDGSLLGSALGSITKAATGTSDLFPEIEDSYKIYSISQNGKAIKLLNDRNVIALVK